MALARLDKRAAVALLTSLDAETSRSSEGYRLNR
jgi:hypothetical protein